jgi:hypothetical protein
MAPERGGLLRAGDGGGRQDEGTGGATGSRSGGVGMRPGSRQFANARV